MNTYSSSILSLFVENCPHALELHRRGVKRDESQFEAGIAAHAILQRLGEIIAATQDGVTHDEEFMQRVADSVVAKLITDGRQFYGEKKAPLSPEAAFAGREIALNYVKSHEVPSNAVFEVELGMNIVGEKPKDAFDERRRVDLSQVRYRALIDVLFETEESQGDWSAELVVVRDYKSAWPTCEDELETLQRKGQAVLAWLHFPNKQGVRMEVVNLRTGATFGKTVLFDEEGEALLRQWRDDILMVCDAADATTEARPGAGCDGCPFLHACEPARKAALRMKFTAEQFAVLEAVRKGMVKQLKAQLEESGTPIFVNGGTIGYKQTQSNVLSEDAIAQILANWYQLPLGFACVRHDQEAALLRALALGAGNITAFAKKRFAGENKIERDEFIELCLQKEVGAAFGVNVATKTIEEIADDQRKRKVAPTRNRRTTTSRTSRRSSVVRSKRRQGLSHRARPLASRGATRARRTKAPARKVQRIQRSTRGKKKSPARHAHTRKRA